ncbi:hypothetical protein [Paenibacillus monticola]|uniref:Uncharacterized protein n=1 Tax=Paenibacillus monticola TaxID=2666075 RepID=A0A7X2HCA0_9BACL|nr:hypothetical protein [Paenibacillus monticola]MRN57376.1 hypothetical protein [Paenibacillus monticola]
MEKLMLIQAVAIFLVGVSVFVQAGPSIAAAEQNPLGCAAFYSFFLILRYKKEWIYINLMVNKTDK